MANIHFVRKLASDELRDTLFFATGTRAERVRTSAYWTLTADKFTVKIVNHKNIYVNGDQCRSIPEAKYVIQELI